MVGSPTYKGNTAIEAKQTYINEDGGYDSETVQSGAQRVGEDRYYGQAIYIKPDWQFHDLGVVFQQWSPEDPSGPWLLMLIENDYIRFGGGSIYAIAGNIAALRGTWIRIVVRLKLAPTGGAFEVWINGKKVISQLNRSLLPKTSNSIRWSSGIYCTDWRTHVPSGPWELSVFHDQARIASTYALAEPANW